MYAEGGVAYVYLCYGIHHLFNVVTNRNDIPEAILISAVQPAEGIETMQRRRNIRVNTTRLTAGPGAMSSALGITIRLNSKSLLSDVLWIEDRGMRIGPSDIIASPRIGVAYAEECAGWPLRFSIKGNEWVSRSK
jgi:DNA-3-methyladenine glycosylase